MVAMRASQVSQFMLLQTIILFIDNLLAAFAVASLITTSGGPALIANPPEGYTFIIYIYYTAISFHFGYIGIGLFVHILCMARINYLYRVTFNDVGVVPLACVCHVIARPSADGRTSTRQCTFYSVDCKECSAHVAVHVLVRVGVTILLGHIPVERPYLGCGTFGVQVLILLHRRKQP